MCNSGRIVDKSVSTSKQQYGVPDCEFSYRRSPDLRGALGTYGVGLLGQPLRFSCAGVEFLTTRCVWIGGTCWASVLNDDAVGTWSCLRDWGGERELGSGCAVGIVKMSYIPALSSGA